MGPMRGPIVLLSRRFDEQGPRNARALDDCNRIAVGNRCGVAQQLRRAGEQVMALLAEGSLFSHAPAANRRRHAVAVRPALVARRPVARALPDALTDQEFWSLTAEDLRA